VLDELEQLTGTKIHTLRVIGGGSRNNVLNQWTADATGRRVLAGPVEATALGNIAAQILGTGAARSISDCRDIISRSTTAASFEPHNTETWEEHLCLKQ
jgi:rhamnulokinase